MNAVSEILQKFQNQNEIPQHEMAKLLQISQATYNNWVNNRIPIDPKYYPKIATLCQIDVATLMPPNATINFMSSTFPTEGISVNALELYKKYTENLEETNRILKNDNEKLLAILEGNKAIITLFQQRGEQ
jgi:transcriptional regulator with XRE-family HTH domain